jgi:hypothetical protein
LASSRRSRCAAHRGLPVLVYRVSRPPPRCLRPRACPSHIAAKFIIFRFPTAGTAPRAPRRPPRRARPAGGPRLRCAIPVLLSIAEPPLVHIPRHRLYLSIGSSLRRAPSRPRRVRPAGCL